MNEVISVSPMRCRVWEHHSRLEEYLTEESCRAEIDSFLAHGQLLPVLGRRIPGNKDYDFEVICGARRLFVARHLNVLLTVEIREFSNKEAIFALEIENCRRKDLSPYERGRSFARWLSDGYFESQEDLARTLRISPSQVSKLLKIGRLPSVIVNAFSKPDDICEAWGVDLYLAWEDRDRRPLLAAKARRMATGKSRSSPHEVYEELLASREFREKRTNKSRDEVVRGTDGRALFRIKHHHQAVALVIGMQNLTVGSLGKIKESLAKVLQEECPQAVEKVVPKSRAPLLSHPTSQSGDNATGRTARLGHPQGRAYEISRAAIAMSSSRRDVD